MYKVQLFKKERVKNESYWFGGDGFVNIYDVKINGILAEPFENSTSRQAFIWTCPNTSQKFIIKLDMLNPGVGHDFDSQSSDEIQLLKEIEPDDLQYFPEIIKHGRYRGIGYVMQPYYEWDNPYDREDSGELEEILIDIIEKYNLSDVSPWSNCGVTTDGRPIIYDFGI